MNKKHVLMPMTAIISILCFNFNKILMTILTFIFEHIYDDMVGCIGPYMKSNPITIEYVVMDSSIYTNKMNLLLNWKWNFDIMGFSVADIKSIKPDSKNMTMHYRKKYDHNQNIHIMDIDFKNKTVTVDKDTREILFNEIHIF